MFLHTLEDESSVCTYSLTHLLGFRFSHRIREISDVKLFTMDKADVTSSLIISKLGSYARQT